MFKRILLVGTGVAVTSVVLFGRDAASYVKTSYHRVTSTVQDQVPMDFQIDRAKQMVRDLDPEIRNSMHVIAKEEVALDQLNQQINGNQEKADKEKKDILHLQADLGEKKATYHYASRTYTCDEVKQDLAKRFNIFKVSDDTLSSMKQMRDARQKNLDAAQQKLGAMINARRKLDVDIQNLEAKRKLVEVAQASSDYVFDDSQLARAKDLINDIRTRLDVAAKLANADVNVQSEIPLENSAPQDITDQVTEYFKLGDKAEKVATAEPTSETAATQVSLAHE